MSTVGIARLNDDVHWTDVWFYGAVPIVFYLALGVVALEFWSGCPWAHDGLAALVTGAFALRNPQRMGSDHLDRAEIGRSGQIRRSMSAART